ncbi:unnamed protein product [Caenorhabditis brenneri]
MIPSYGVSLLIVGLTGVILNFILILKFLGVKKNSMSSFHKLCLFKAIPNLIISASFPFWICPLSFLELHASSIPRLLNISIAEFVGIFCYYFAPLILICMSLNRFNAIYFPFSSSPKFPFTNCAILGCLLLASGPVLVPKFYGCSFIYDPELGIFISEDVENCGQVMDRFIIYSILALAFLSNGFNLAIFAKLVKDKVLGISEDQKNKRKKKWQAMYIQSVIQDFLQVLDIINFNLISANCYLVYEPEILIFLPEQLENCGHVMDRSVFFTIGVLSLTANGFNLAIFTKLLKDKMGGISEAQKNKRRKKWQSMYIQSVIQDFIQLIDITNYNFTSKIYDAPLWTFLFCCLSFASVYALDGIVMIYFHSDWSVCRKIHTVKKTNFFVSGVQSSGPKSGVVVG